VTGHCCGSSSGDQAHNVQGSQLSAGACAARTTNTTQGYLLYSSGMNAFVRLCGCWGTYDTGCLNIHACMSSLFHAWKRDDMHGNPSCMVGLGTLVVRQCRPGIEGRDCDMCGAWVTADSPTVHAVLHGLAVQLNRKTELPDLIWPCDLLLESFCRAAQLPTARYGTINAEHCNPIPDVAVSTHQRDLPFFEVLPALNRTESIQHGPRNSSS